MLRIGLVCLVLVLALVSEARAERGRMFEDQDSKTRVLEELSEEVNRVMLYLDMLYFAALPNQHAHCGKFREKANENDEKARELELFADSDGIVTEQESADLKEAKRLNQEYQQDYESCFSTLLVNPGYQQDQHLMSAYYRLQMNGLSSFDLYDAKRKELEGSLGHHAASYDTAQAYLVELVDRTKSLSEELDDDYAGHLVSVFGDVDVFRENGWEAARQGMLLYQDSEIRTGSTGRARIELNDRVEEGNRGPTVINVGSYSQIRMEKFEVSFTDPPERTGVLDMIRGTIRVFTKNWGLRSAFSVRTGTSLCGIRGTDVIIDYRPRSGILSYALNHGVVEISTPASPDPIVLEPGHRLLIDDGAVAQHGEMWEGQWQFNVDLVEGGSDEPPL